MPAADHWTDAANLAMFVVEVYQVQRHVRGSGIEGEMGCAGEWVDVPDCERAVELEGFDLCEELAREFPATRYRVVRRLKGRA
jgi:hypothetical protein